MSVTLSPVLAPKKPAWLKASAAIAVAALMFYLGAAWMRPWQPGRIGGLVFGTLAAALFFNAGLYPLRRRWRAWPLATVQQWLQLHIYGSVVAFLFVLIHVGFRLPSGAMGWWLFLLSLWTALTGIAGVLLQKWVPVVISRNLKTEAIFERIPGLTATLAARADAAATGAGDTLARAFASVRPLLAAPALRWGYLFEVRQSRARQLEPLTRVEPFVEGDDRDKLRDLLAIVNEKLDLDVHASLQRVLRAWLVIHIPAAIVLLGLLVVHIFAVVYL
jgi:hypothetical protein